MKQKLLSLLLTLLMPVCAINAQATHWQYNPHDYEYDMTVYISLKYYANLSNFEIAAFCGEECRGVADLIDIKNGQLGYLRIRSNSVSGETITFKAYLKDTQEEVELESETVMFVSNVTLGTPSKPFQMVIPMSFLPGDVNGDGEINVGDVSAVINYILKRPNTTFIAAAADMNGDGEINVGDVSAIINNILKRN